MNTLSPAIGNAAIVSRRASVADQPRCRRSRILPQARAGTRIERDHGVRVGHIHHAVMNLRRSLQTSGVRHGEDPLHGHPAYVGAIDLRHRRVPISAELAMHARPIRLRCYAPVLFTGFAQQVNALIVRAELQLAAGAAERETFQF